jgi:hypothetical protein
VIVPCSRLWPAPENEVVHWGMLAGKCGATPEMPRPFLLAIRGAKPGDAMTHQPVHRPGFDDTFALFVRDAHPVRIFTGSTHAFQLTSTQSPDTDGDGIGDVGSVRPGRYVMHLLPGKYPSFQIKSVDGSELLPAFRDFDHNGVISEAEAAKSLEWKHGAQVNQSIGCYATGVLFHCVAGMGAPADVGHKGSIACFTAPLNRLELLRDAAKPGTTIDMALVNAWELVDLVPALTAPEGIA